MSVCKSCGGLIYGDLKIKVMKKFAGTPMCLAILCEDCWEKVDEFIKDKCNAQHAD